MLSRSVYATDVRVRREAETLADSGHRVQVIGLGANGDPYPGVNVVGLGEVTGLRPGRGRSRGRGVFYKAARWALLPSHRAAATREFESEVEKEAAHVEFSPDVVHAHDLPALAIGSRLAEDRSAALVYDSHEIWGDMQRHGRPEPLARRRSLNRQRQLAADATAVITVSEAAAAVLADRLGRSDITVIHNSFPTRHDLDPPDRPKGIVYSGRISPGRDLETAFAAMDDVPSLGFHLIGPVEGGFEVPDFARLHQPADLDTVERLLADLGIALVPLERGPLNHDVALPNKLFEAVSVGIPVVAADLPELRRVVDSHELGRLYRPGDSNSLKQAVTSLQAEYGGFLESVKAAQTALDWSHDARSLLDVYERIAQGIPGTGRTPN